jgi:hypothetical protein
VVTAVVVVAVVPSGFLSERIENMAAVAAAPAPALTAAMTAMVAFDILAPKLFGSVWPAAVVWWWLGSCRG